MSLSWSLMLLAIAPRLSLSKLCRYYFSLEVSSLSLTSLKILLISSKISSTFLPFFLILATPVCCSGESYGLGASSWSSSISSRFFSKFSLSWAYFLSIIFFCYLSLMLSSYPSIMMVTKTFWTAV